MTKCKCHRVRFKNGRHVTRFWCAGHTHTCQSPACGIWLNWAKGDVFTKWVLTFHRAFTSLQITHQTYFLHSNKANSFIFRRSYIRHIPDIFLRTKTWHGIGQTSSCGFVWGMKEGCRMMDRTRGITMYHMNMSCSLLNLDQNYHDSSFHHRIYFSC